MPPFPFPRPMTLKKTAVTRLLQYHWHCVIEHCINHHHSICGTLSERHRRRLSGCTGCNCTQQNSAALFFVTLFYTPFSFLQDNNINVTVVESVLSVSTQLHVDTQYLFSLTAGDGREGRGGEGRGRGLGSLWYLLCTQQKKYKSALMQGNYCLIT